MKAKTMLSSSVVETDAFLSLPLTAQALYVHLNLYADSMGALDSITIPKRACGASDDDLAALYGGGWLIEVEGVTFIRHWHVHNTVREKDRRSAHMDLLKRQVVIADGEPYRLKSGSTRGVPGAYPGRTLLNKQVNKQLTNSETAAPAGAGGGSAEICPQCGDYLTAGRCFTCNFTAPQDASEAGK